MKFLFTLFTLFTIGLTLVTPARAEMMHECSHAPTIQALRECVQHAAHHGHITQPRVAQGLIATLDAAQRAVDRGQPAVAVRILNAFIQAVGKLSGTFIEPHHAEHLQMHAREVIRALGT